MSSYFVESASNGPPPHQMPLFPLQHSSNPSSHQHHLSPPPTQHRSLVATLLNNTNVSTNNFPQFYTRPSQPPPEDEEDDDEDEDEDADDDDDQEEDVGNHSAMEERTEKDRKPSIPTTVNVTPKAIVETAIATKKEIENNDTPSKKLHTDVKTADHGSILETDLLKENRDLRKKVELLMKHNMQLMVGIKDRDHKIYKQKQVLAKYRKALLRFFEENGNDRSDSSEDEELSNMSNAEERKALPMPREKKEPKEMREPKEIREPREKEFKEPIIHNFPPLSYNHPTAFSPIASPVADDSNALDSPDASEDVGDRHDFEDISSNNGGEGMFSEFYAGTGSKKRKQREGGDEDKQEKKRAKGTRRNALWSTEDDELFAKVYNVYGKSWKTIHNFLPNKTREQVQSHGQYLIRIGKLEDVKGGTKRGRKAGKKTQQPDTPPPQSTSSATTTPNTSHANTSNYSQSNSSQVYQYHFETPDSPPQM